MTQKHESTKLEQSLYGLMAYRELTTFERLSSDARFSPTLADRAALAKLAVTEYGHFELACDELTAAGRDPEAVMEPFMEIIDELHERTRPGDWYESLMKAYVLDAVSADFYRVAAERLSEQARLLARRIQELDEQSAWLTERLRADIDDERLRSRLALWGRRLLGEALTKARFVLDTTDLGSLFSDEERKELYADLIRKHSRRMAALKLTA
ncbi:ferritin-like fold-containing protein [Zhihengliuella halotolerans]|uniref:ferritin-like fold-containing protein n=1 Tax=Zhihengliuella halotolerans TaxID=370736 RepID=UPI000C801AC0|nr:ferritin-like fold-containing protein [Zhihengliuella halotolerans]